MKLRKILALVGLSTAMVAAGATTVAVGGLNAKNSNGELVKKVDAIPANTYRFTYPSIDGWSGDLYCYAYGNGENAGWPGVKMTWKYDNTMGQGVFEYAAGKAYPNVIFTANAKQTVDITVGSDNTWYLGSGSTNGEGKYDDVHGFNSNNRSFYMYDVENTLKGSAKMYAWRDGLHNNTWPGAVMTKDTTHYAVANKFVYSVTGIDEAYNKAIFTNKTEGSVQTDDINMDTDASKNCYVLRATNSGEWVTKDKMDAMSNFDIENLLG